MGQHATLLDESGPAAAEESVPRVRRVVDTALPTPVGSFTAVGFSVEPGAGELLALVCGDVAREGVWVYPHSACLVADTLAGTGCDCRRRLAAATEWVAAHGGVIVYLPPAEATSQLTRALPHQQLDPEQIVLFGAVLAQLAVSSVRRLEPALPGSSVPAPAAVEMAPTQLPR